MRILVLQENSGDSAVGTSLRGHHEHQPVGHDHQPALYHDVGLALRVVGADELIGDAQLLAERSCPRLFGEKGIRTGLDQAAFDVIGRHAAAQPLAAFEERVLQLGASGARLLQIKGGAQSGDASADDCNPLHAVSFKRSSQLSHAASARLAMRRQPGFRQIGNRAYE